MKVSIAFFSTHALHTPLDTYDTLQLYPVKLQRSKRIAGKFLAFAAVVVRVPDNPALVIPFDQHHPGAGAQIAAHRGHRHGIGLIHLGVDSLLQPLIKLLKRVAAGSFLIQLRALIAFAQISYLGRNLAHGLIVHWHGYGLLRWAQMFFHRTTRKKICLLKECVTNLCI